MRRVGRDVRRRQSDGLAGVEQIELFGVQPERIFLTVSNARLSQLGIPPQAIVDTPAGAKRSPAGREINAEGQSVRSRPPARSTRHRHRGSCWCRSQAPAKTIALKDIVEVVRGLCRPAAAAGFLQRPAGDRPQRLHPRRCQCGGVWPAPEAAGRGDRAEPADRLCAGVRYLSAGAGRTRGKRSDQQPRADARHCHLRRRAVPRDPRRPDRRCLYPADHPALPRRHVNLGGRPAAYVDRGCDHRARHHGRQRHRRCGSNAQPPGSGRRPSDRQLWKQRAPWAYRC